MILLFYIGTTHTPLGLAAHKPAVKHITTSPANCSAGDTKKSHLQFVGHAVLEGAVLCSVVPRATPLVCAMVRRRWHLDCLQLTPKTLRGVGIDYPRPKTIGPDRLANAVAVARHYGAPAVVVDFGTAVTFDVVDRAGN